MITSMNNKAQKWHVKLNPKDTNFLKIHKVKREIDAFEKGRIK